MKLRHFKILLESVKCDFDEISNEEYLNLTAGKVAMTIAHQSNNFKANNQKRFLVIPRTINFSPKN